MIDEGLKQSAFWERMIEILASADYDWIIEAKGADGLRPVGLVLALSVANGRGIEPHVAWFPWASGRNKMEGSAIFLREHARQFKVFIYACDADEPFWLRMTNYRILRKGCRIIDYYARGEHSMMFYTVGP